MSNEIRRTEKVEYFEDEVENKNPYPEVFYDAFGSPVTVNPGEKKTIIRARLAVDSDGAEASISVKVTKNKVKGGDKKDLMEKKSDGSRLRKSNRPRSSRNRKSK